jgi:hypothetical protein
VKQKYPNQSVLSIITGTEQGLSQVDETAGIEHLLPIFFIYMKAAPDFKEKGELYWMADGEPSILWDRLNIRHWQVFGTDDQIAAEYESLLGSGFIDCGKWRLVLPKVTRTLEETIDPNLLTAQKAETLVITDPGSLPSEFCHQENLAALSGYRAEQQKIKPIRPAGFYAPDFLFNRLSKNIIGYCQPRKAHLRFRGVRSTKIEGEGSTQLTGFYQQNFKPDVLLTAVARRRDSHEIGRATISTDNGLFKMDLSEPNSRGIIQVDEGGEIVYGQNFTLLQSISGNVNMANKTFTDAYGREFGIFGDEVKRPVKIVCSSWYGPDYADEKAADIHLADKFKELFDFLGPRVLISDPYYLGPFRRGRGERPISLSRDQIAFLSSLMRAVVEGSVEELYILGYNARAKNADRKPEEPDLTIVEALFRDYHQLLLRTFASYQLSLFGSKFRMQFLNNKRDLHGRYWFRINTYEGIDRLDRCVIMTNSLGNISEIDIIQVKEVEQLRELTMRYIGFLKNCEEQLTI